MKKWLNLIFTIIIIALLVYVLWGIDFYEVYFLVVEGNFFWFSMAFLVTFFSFVFWNIRCQYLFKPFIKRGSFWFLFHVIFAGAFFNTVTPGAGVGGEPFRTYYLAKRYKKPSTTIFGYVVSDTFFRLTTFAFFILISGFFILFFLTTSLTLKLTLGLVLVFVLFSLIVNLYFLLARSHFKFGKLFKKFYFLGFLKKKFKSEKHLSDYITKWFMGVLTIVRRVVKRRDNFMVGMLLAIVFWILHFLAAYFLFLSFGFNANLFSIIAVVSLAEIIGSLSILPGGVGVAESSMVLLYSVMGIPLSLAFLVSFLTRIIFYFFALFIGGISLMHLKRKCK